MDSGTQPSKALGLADGAEARLSLVLGSLALRLFALPPPALHQSRYMLRLRGQEKSSGSTAYLAQTQYLPTPVHCDGAVQ